MTHMVQELKRFKAQTAGNDDATEALSTLLKQANLLRCVPAVTQTLLRSDIKNLYVQHCGKMHLGRQPHRGQWRDLKTVNAMACRWKFLELSHFHS